MPDEPLIKSPMKSPLINSRLRKGSFNLCTENETGNLKLENLKRKSLIKDVLEKKMKQN